MISRQNVLIVTFLLITPCLLAFQRNDQLQRTSVLKRNIVIRTKPLSTATTGLLSHIPRLEIGLRHLSRAQDHISRSLDIPNISLKWLVNMDDSQSKLKESIALTEFFSKMMNFLTRSISSLKKIVSSACHVAKYMFAAPLRSSIAIGSTVCSIPIVCQATSFKKYSSLSAVQKLGTTPVFYLSNPSGNPYLQEDVQVLLTCFIIFLILFKIYFLHFC
jgi:hypothetical protein